MIILRILLITLLGSLLSSVTSCTTDEFQVDRNVAIMIASADVPSNILNHASVVTVYDESSWTIYFLLTKNNTVTKEMLGWPEDPDIKFENQGILPKGSYSQLIFNIDRRTGAVLSRTASDAVLIGGPGIFNKEPPGKVFLPLWSAIVSGIGGLIIGGTAMWFIVRRKRFND